MGCGHHSPITKRNSKRSKSSFASEKKSNDQSSSGTLDPSSEKKIRKSSFSPVGKAIQAIKILNPERSRRMSNIQVSNQYCSGEILEMSPPGSARISRVGSLPDISETLKMPSRLSSRQTPEFGKALSRKASISVPKFPGGVQPNPQTVRNENLSISKRGTIISKHDTLKHVEDINRYYSMPRLRTQIREIMDKKQTPKMSHSPSLSKIPERTSVRRSMDLSPGYNDSTTKMSKTQRYSTFIKN